MKAKRNSGGRQRPRVPLVPLHAIGDDERRTPGPATKGVGLRIALEALADRIEPEAAAQPVRDVAEVAERGREIAGLDVGVRLRAAAHTREEIRHVLRL